MSWKPKIGMRVVCIDLEGFKCKHMKKPEIGTVYTISAHDFVFGLDSLQLEELPTHGDDGWIHWYCKDHFRPLVKRKTSIAQFQAMLKDTREKVDA